MCGLLFAADVDQSESTEGSFFRFARGRAFRELLPGSPSNIDSLRQSAVAFGEQPVRKFAVIRTQDSNNKSRPATAHSPRPTGTTVPSTGAPALHYCTVPPGPTRHGTALRRAAWGRAVQYSKRAVPADTQLAP